jgi:DNA-binding transcriptional regulator YhcF (GntR family)
MSQKKSLTIKNVAQLLHKKGLIYADQHKGIVVKGDAQNARLQSW